MQFKEGDLITLRVPAYLFMSIDDRNDYVIVWEDQEISVIIDEKGGRYLCSGLSVTILHPTYGPVEVTKSHVLRCSSEDT